MWLQDESCTPYIIQTWGSLSHQLTLASIKEKIQQMGVSLHAWESRHFGNINSQLVKAREQLQKIQSLPSTDENNKASKIIEQKIHTLMKREETMWHQRSRVNWIKDGDKNTNFFHRIANGRQKRNSIDHIKCDDGTIVEDEHEVANVLTKYFSSLFTSTTDLNLARAIDALDPMVTDEDNELLNEPFTEMEIVVALKQMHPSKSPGPDDAIHHSQSVFVPGRLITDNALLAYEIFHAMKINTAKKRGTFALKLDMSKAYDHVEWNFLEHILLKIGFKHYLVSLIMRCASTVSYSVITNGIPGPIFFPTRGLRQGDPLSPYLFILRQAKLFHSLYGAEMGGFIHVAKICKRAPTVSHLFFADDSMIFGRANEGEITTIKSIISDYSAASGKIVNFEKSEINFSKGVQSNMAETLASCLGVKYVDKHQIYLGLPATTERNKKAFFSRLWIE
ncbi:hypothetical protein DH2020_001005 [Rehmannia glutinosa]|uniref:Reverse transcriptase domain-containing protein n=1 Tax=Rehmannia glutinosa TaxID=99300 RepID=A0ABR0XYG6_REHGL